MRPKQRIAVSDDCSDLRRRRFSSFEVHPGHDFIRDQRGNGDANGGESIKYVSTQLGHASVQITADVYAHVFRTTSVSAMNRLNMRLSATMPAEDDAQVDVA